MDGPRSKVWILFSPSLHISSPPSPPLPLLSLAELYRLVLVLSANQALGFGFVLFFPLKIILFLPPAENHKRESGAIKTAKLLNLVSLNWFPAILSGPQASLAAMSALHTLYSAPLSLPLEASTPDFTIEADARRLRLFVFQVSFPA